MSTDRELHAAFLDEEGRLCFEEGGDSSNFWSCQAVSLHATLVWPGSSEELRRQKREEYENMKPKERTLGVDSRDILEQLESKPTS